MRVGWTGSNVYLPEYVCQQLEHKRVSPTGMTLSSIYNLMDYAKCNNQDTEFEINHWYKT